MKRRDPSSFFRFNARGFTLVEILVVMALIGLLISLLLPALTRAREESRRAACLSQLRQMGIAAFSYATRHNGSLPPAYRRDIGTGDSYGWDLSTVVENGRPAIQPGLLWEGQGDTRIQQCPSFEGAANWNQDPYTGYNYNSSYLGGYELLRYGERIDGAPSAALDEIKKPSLCAMFGDGEWSGGANKFMRAPGNGPLDAGFSGRAAGTQGFRHNGFTNVAFADGHVESLAARFDADQADLPNHCGFLSNDNRLYDLE